jgi:hypothetical protein
LVVIAVARLRFRLYGRRPRRPEFEGKAILAEVDRICLHDAVLNVAVVWTDIWGKF